MKNSFTIIFYPRRSRATKNGQFPIYARVTINGERLNLATHRGVEPGKWSATHGNAKGNSEEAQSINSFLESFRNNIHRHYTELLNRNLEVSPTSLKKQILGIRDDQRTILEVFAQHNAEVESRVGKEYAKATALKFRSTIKHIREYISHRYKKNDLNLNQIDHSFVHEFDLYLKNVRNCNHNSALKYVKLFRKIVRKCLAHGWMEKDPFAGFKGKVKFVERDYLTEQELSAIEEKEFNIQRLDLVRDIFVFSCYTGISYIDITKLNNDNIIQDNDETMWISMLRTKTKGRMQIMLLPKALELLKKYEQYPVNSNKNLLLPTFSNQKMNAYLKEIAHLCEVKKHLTFHTARHTFATTVTLTNGVPMETVSAMLGHKSLRTTQIYSRILKVKIGIDMKDLREKLAKRG